MGGGKQGVFGGFEPTACRFAAPAAEIANKRSSQYAVDLIDRSLAGYGVCPARKP